MPNPYQSGPHIIEVNADDGETCVELRVPHRGTIDSVKFNQLSGDEVNCAFELYTSRLACPPGASVSESLSEAVQGSRDAYSIFGAKTRLANTPFQANNDSMGNSYTNKDGTPTNPQRKLYLAVRPAGSGPKTFELTMTILTSLM